LPMRIVVARIPPLLSEVDRLEIGFAVLRDS
jgi:hypothetical protein